MLHRLSPPVVLRRSISRWLADEDANLLRLHGEYGPSWSIISTKCTGRNAVECRRRFLKLTNVITDEVKSTSEVAKAINREKRDENMRIREGWERTASGDSIKVPMDNLGLTPFHTLATLVPVLRHRWDRKGWLPEEKRAILEGVFEFGPDNKGNPVLSGWARIAKGLQRRTGDQCRGLYEREFILHADSGLPDIEALKERLFKDSRDGRNEQRIFMQCDD